MQAKRIVMALPPSRTLMVSPSPTDTTVAAWTGTAAKLQSSKQQTCLNACFRRSFRTETHRERRPYRYQVLSCRIEDSTDSPQLLNDL